MEVNDRSEKAAEMEAYGRDVEAAEEIGKDTEEDAVVVME